jgi:hypothetical protein
MLNNKSRKKNLACLLLKFNPLVLPTPILCNGLKTFQSLFKRIQWILSQFCQSKPHVLTPLVTEKNKIIFVKTKIQVLNNGDAMWTVMFFTKKQWTLTKNLMWRAKWTFWRGNHMKLALWQNVFLLCIYQSNCIFLIWGYNTQTECSYKPPSTIMLLCPAHT